MTAIRDIAHTDLDFGLNELVHQYGERVHVLSDLVAATLLARLCSPQTTQPEINRLVRRLYERLVVAVINDGFPRKLTEVTSRMAADNPRGVYQNVLIDMDIEVVTVDIARAGIVPSMVCYELLNELMNPEKIRQDHLMVSRSVDASAKVSGATITGGKIGGPIDGRIVLFPDPMGATGSSLSAAMAYYKSEWGNARAMACLNLIITPQYIKRILKDHPEAYIYALRLDRGMSAVDVLQTVPGSRWDEETGLNEKDYIIPGGGGFGELMNNSWV